MGAGWRFPPSPPSAPPSIAPAWQTDLNTRYEPLQPFEHYEHGKDADSSFKNLLKDNSKVENITSSIGAEVFGVQLSQLDDKGKDDLALFVAQKKVVVFRDQVRETIEGRTDLRDPQC